MAVLIPTTVLFSRRTDGCFLMFVVNFFLFSDGSIIKIISNLTLTTTTILASSDAKKKDVAKSLLERYEDV